MDPKGIGCEYENLIRLVHYEIEGQAVVQAVMKVGTF
jgi:hypothetical protein